MGMQKIRLPGWIVTSCFSRFNVRLCGVVLRALYINVTWELIPITCLSVDRFISAAQQHWQLNSLELFHFRSN